MLIPLFQVVTYFHKTTELCLLCIADVMSLKEYVLRVSRKITWKILSIPSKSWHYENVVVRPRFVVLLQLLGKWLKVAGRLKCRLVCGQEYWTRQADVESENVNY